MSGYTPDDGLTPTTERVRHLWVADSREPGESFDRWLDSVKAEAWNEGLTWLMTEQGIPFAHLADELHANPYRSEK